MQIEHFGQIGSLHEHLLFWNQLGDEVGFGVVEMKQAPGAGEVQVGVRQKELRRAAFDHRPQEIARPEVLAALGREQHRGVLLAPGLERFCDVVLQRAVLHKAPRFIEHKQFELRRRAHIADGRARAMEDVKQQRLEQQLVLVESLEVKALEALERQRVVGVIEEIGIRAALDPAIEVLGQGAGQGASEGQQAALRRVEGIETLDGIFQFTAAGRAESILAIRLHEDADERDEKMKVLVR